MKQVNCNSECMYELCTSWGAACGGFGVRIRYAINRSCPRRGIADMMTACEPCRWTFQVSLTLCRLYSEGVIETYTDLTRGAVSRTGWGRPRPAAAAAACVATDVYLNFSAPTRPQPRTPNPQGDGDFATVRSCLGVRD